MAKEKIIVKSSEEIQREKDYAINMQTITQLQLDNVLLAQQLTQAQLDITVLKGGR